MQAAHCRLLFPLAKIAKSKTCPAHASGQQLPRQTRRPARTCCACAGAHTHVVVDAAPHDGFPGRWCAALLPRSQPLPGAALELQQDQQARKLGGGVVGQRAQQQVVDIVHVNPANGEEGSSSTQTKLCQNTHGWGRGSDGCGWETARRDCCLHRQVLSVQPGNDLLVAADAILQNLEGCCCQEMVCQHTQEGRQVGVEGLILLCRQLLSGGVD